MATSRLTTVLFVEKPNLASGVLILDRKTVRIFAYSSTYARVVKQKIWNAAENRELDWRETPKILFLSPHFARVGLLRHALPISFLILREKTDCFAVYINIYGH